MTMPPSVAAAAAEFAEHVELDEGVLATTAPLALSSLDRIVLLVADGLQQAPDLHQRIHELRERLMTERSIGAAEAVAGMLELLAQQKEAEQYFKGVIVQVLKGDSLPLRSPSFAAIGARASPAKKTSTPSTEPATSSKATTKVSTPSATPVKETKPPSASMPQSKPPRPSAGSPAIEVATPSPSRTRRESTARNGAPALPSPSPATPSSSGSAASTTTSTTTATSASTLSPISSTPARKRSVDSTYSSSSEQRIPEPAKKKKGKPKMATNGKDPHAKPASYPIKDRNDPSLHPLDAIPTPWEELHYKPVEVININAPGAKDKIEALRYSSTPFVLEGYSKWMQFANDWVLPNGSLDTEAFLRGLHDVKVPVIEKNYEDTNPIKTHLPLAYYVKNYWEKGKSDFYLHQWQFPLAPKAAKLLCYKCEELPVLGDNLLLYWLDAVRGDNPLQYFFMGQRNTNSRMHQDPGGLDITIAPIVGTKRVTMLHKSAAKIDSVHDQINFHQVDLDKSPLLAFCPAWRVDIKPGQMLFMPEGTFHACENITACLSYHRFHVDHVSLPGFLASFLAQDSPSINHAEILWNAVHDVIAALEENLHANVTAIDTAIETHRKLDSLRALRHAARVLSLEETLPTEDSWDWKKLLEDIDHLLLKIDPTAAKATHAKKKKKKTPSTASTDVMEVDVEEEDGDDDGVDDDGAEEDTATAPPATTATRTGTSAATTSTVVATTSAVVAAALNHGKKTLSTHWEELRLKVGDTIGVQVFERRNKATVRKIALNIELVQIHYVDWGSIYDEFLPVTSLYQRSTRSSKRVPYRKAPKVHETVLAKWGSNAQLFNAIVLKVIRSNACLVHYLKFENDWDQWVLPGHIFKNYALSKDKEAVAG